MADSRYTQPIMAVSSVRRVQSDAISRKEFLKALMIRHCEIIMTIKVTTKRYALIDNTREIADPPQS